MTDAPAPVHHRKLPPARGGQHVMLQPDGWPQPKGYSNGVKAHGEMVFIGGMVGGRTKFARELQKQFLTPGQPPLGIGEGLILYPYLGTLSQQAASQELARKMKESRRRRG